MDKIAAINGAFRALPDMQDGWFDVRERLLQMNLDAERQHRRNERCPKRFSAVTAAKYFVCKHLMDALTEPDRYSVDDILHIRTEILYAQAYAKAYKDKLTPWAQQWREQIADVDYAKLMQVAS